MANFQNVSDVSLNQNEYCVLVGSQYYNNSSFRVKIPKLMTNVTSPMNDPFNRNILVNAKDCKPFIDNSLNVKNYINVKRSSQCSLLNRIINYDNESHYYGYLPDNLGVICLCMNGNYRDMIITDSI